MRAVFAALAVASALVSITITAGADEGAVPAVPASPAEVAEARSELGTTLGQMRASALRVRDQLRLARKRGTKLQITCVDEALSRSDVALRRARDLGDEALAAYARNDVEAARMARHQLGKLRDLQRAASADAIKCMPRAAPLPLASTTTTVKLDVDPRIARVD
jgi:hypothetical protein